MIVLQITQEHIDRGEPGSSCMCPITLALIDRLANHYSINSYPSIVRITNLKSEITNRLDIDMQHCKGYQEFISQFDKVSGVNLWFRKHIKPCKIRINVPRHMLRAS